MNVRQKALLIVGAALCLTLILAAPSHAVQYASGGQIGPSSVGQGACKYMRNTVNGWLQIETAPPTIYARNSWSGSGNDWQLVRYRAFLVNAYNGTVVASTGYSGNAWAGDNTPARFSGITTFSGDWRGNYRVEYRVEWLSSTGAVVGWAAHSFNSYRYFNQMIGPYGPISSCAKIM
jgi:hypothetical protein